VKAWIKSDENEKKTAEAEEHSFERDAKIRLCTATRGKEGKKK